MTDSVVAPVPAPIAEGIFTLPPYDEAAPHLLGGRCLGGHGPFFPRPRYCPVCLDETEEADLGSEAKIYSFTVVRTRAPLGLPEPYSVGYVDMAGSGLRVFCLLDPNRIEELEVGRPARLVVEPLGTNGAGEPRLRPYFTPATAVPAEGDVEDDQR